MCENPKNYHSWKKLAQTASPASPSFSISTAPTDSVVFVHTRTLTEFTKLNLNQNKESEGDRIDS